jgi:hypothetical protein
VLPLWRIILIVDLAERSQSILAVKDSQELAGKPEGLQFYRLGFFLLLGISDWYWLGRVRTKGRARR